MQVIVNGVPIYYEERGSGVPLVCLHGFPEDHRTMLGCLEPNAAHLEGFRRIYPDLPGMGRSPARPDVRGADDMLGTVRLFIDEVVGEADFLLAGQSYGGYLTLGLLHRMSRRIAGAFLLCPCVLAAREARALPQRTTGSPDITLKPGDSAEDYAEFKDYTAVVTDAVWARYKAEVLPGLKAADEAFVERYQSGGGYGFSFEEELRTLVFGGPACFLAGNQDDCVGYEDAWRVARGFGQASFTVVDGAGHNLQLERPDWFDFCLREWLGRVRTAFA